MPSNTRLVSGPAVGTAQTLSSGPTPECSCLQCPQLPESGIFFCGDSHSPFIHSIHTVCPPDCVGLICSLYSWWKGERFSILFLSHNAKFNCGFIPTSECESSTGVCSWGCLGGRVSALVTTGCRGGAATSRLWWPWQCQECRGAGGHRYRDIVLLGFF